MPWTRLNPRGDGAPTTPRPGKEQRDRSKDKLVSPYDDTLPTFMVPKPPKKSGDGTPRR